MCEEGNNRKGKAFILIKSGRNMEGVLIIAEIFLESIQEYLRGLFKKIEYGMEKKERIMSQLQVVLNTCYKEWTIDNDRGVHISLLRNKFGRRSPNSSSKSSTSTTSTANTSPTPSAASSTK